MHEGPRTLGFGAELAARIQEELFYDLEAPVLRATGFDTPYPPARLEKLWLPGPDRLIDCVERAMEHAVSAVRDFLVPDLGEGLEDATITGWSVAVGDDVELNQTLCTVETNKAEVEIPSPYAGRIVELGGAEGETLTVGAVLVRIATSSSRPSPSPRRRVPTAQCASRSWSATAPTTRWTPAGEDRSMTRPRAKPPVRKLAAELNVDLAAGDGFRPGRSHHARGCACRGGQVGAYPGHGGGARRAGHHGAADDVVAQPDSRCARQRSGRLLGLLRVRDRLRDSRTTSRRSRRSC